PTSATRSPASAGPSATSAVGWCCWPTCSPSSFAAQDNKALVAPGSLVSAGVWWALFTTLPLVLLRNRPAVAGEHRGGVLTDGFRQLGNTPRHLRAYPLTLFFLLA